MRVTIEQHEKTTGLIRKTTLYIVTYQVFFSDEEKQIIKQRKLEDHILQTTPANEHHGVAHLLLRDLPTNKPRDTSFSTPLSAKNYEVELTEMLTNLKEYIYNNASMELGKKTIDLLSNSSPLVFCGRLAASFSFG